MKSKIVAFSVLVGSLICSGSAFAQTRPEPPTVRPEPPTVTGPERPPLPDALRELIEQFRLERQAILEARRALMERLKTATEEEKRAILEEFRKEQRERIEAERELRRQIREQLQELRRQRRTAGSGD